MKPSTSPSARRTGPVGAVDEFVRGLRHELRVFDGRTWFLALGTLCLVVVWLYFGSARFFREHFADLVAGHSWADAFPWLWYHVAALLLLAALPLTILRAAFGVRPSELGFRVGDWRFGAKAVVIGVVIATPILWITSTDPAFQREYPLWKLAGRDVGTLAAWELTFLIYFAAWESYFRGVLLFGLKDRLGVAGALAFQAAVSCLVHIGKPFGETFIAAPFGFLVGALALRTGSVLWPFLLHYYIGVMTDLFCHLHARPD